MHELLETTKKKQKLWASSRDCFVFCFFSFFFGVGWRALCPSCVALDQAGRGAKAPLLAITASFFFACFVYFISI